MCGIFGIVDKKSAVSEHLVRELTDLVAHRGPDGSGTHVNRNLGLGHRRLAIIDLSSDGIQPMRHRQYPLWITYNGEIYNYIELRKELQDLGAVFETATDTEVLLNAYLTWGEECVNRFNGMWSFAIHDERDNTLFCARDRFGVKPFYYVDTPAAFAFGSEIRQLLPLIGKRVADSELVNDFLICGLTDHTTRTFFGGIERLAPGHWLRVDVSTGQFTTNRYYSPHANAPAASENDVPRQLHDLLDDATRLRLRSDVRVGTCLSGGLDSSSVATLAAARHAENSDEPFFAITAGSEQASNNEEKYAARIVEQSRLGWKRIRPSYEEFAATMDTLIDVQEEPFGGPSIMMQYEVMKAARANGITVLLDGQGGDETLLGYQRYYAAWLLDHLRRGGVRGFVSAFWAAAAITPVPKLLMYLIGASSAVVRERVYRWNYGFLKNPRLPDALKRFAWGARNADVMQLLEITETSLPMLLRFEDKNSMHFAIETRLPFLDYRLVEFGLALPVGIKLNKGWTKWPLRAAMQGKLCNEICWRKDKIGFAAPDQIWLNRHAGVMYEKVMASSLVGQFVDLNALKKRFHRLDTGMRWRLYCLALWAERFRIEAS